jgi:hypothetical protein
LKAQEKDARRLEALRAARLAYEAAARRRVEADLAFRNDPVHAEVLALERARDQALAAPQAHP